MIMMMMMMMMMPKIDNILRTVLTALYIHYSSPITGLRRTKRQSCVNVD